MRRFEDKLEFDRVRRQVFDKFVCGHATGMQIEDEDESTALEEGGTEKPQFRAGQSFMVPADLQQGDDCIENVDVGSAEECDAIARGIRDGTVEGYVCQYVDTPDLRRVESAEEPVSMHEHVLAALETEKSLPPHLRLVSNMRL